MKACCNDYRLIKAKGPKPVYSTVDQWISTLTLSSKSSDSTHVISPRETNDWHQQHTSWLDEEIKKIQQENESSKQNGGTQLKVVVLTHHAPSRYSCIIPQEEEIVEMNYGDVEWLMEDPVVRQ